LSADGRVLAFYSNDTVRVRDFGAGRECARALPAVDGYGIALNANGTRAATWTRNRRPVEVWDLARSEREREIPTDWSGRATFSPDNQWLVTCGLVEYRVWNLRNWNLEYSIRRGLSCDVDFIAFSPDARTLAVALTRDAVRLVEAATGRELATLQSSELTHVNGIAFSPDGHRLAIPTALGPIQLWDLRALRHELAGLNLDW
jgi:WD40 repeat protein